jgi:uncharacterized Zn finger protein (UPF0148 family)
MRNQEEENKEHDAFTGKICSICGTVFKEPKDGPVACNSCYFELDEWDREIFQKADKEEK